MLLKKITDETEKAISKVHKLDTAIKAGDAKKTKTATDDLRENIDALEGLIPADLWPLPSYAEMLFVL